MGRVQRLSVEFPDDEVQEQLTLHDPRDIGGASYDTAIEIDSAGYWGPSMEATVQITQTVEAQADIRAVLHSMVINEAHAGGLAAPLCDFPKTVRRWTAEGGAIWWRIEYDGDDYWE